METASLQSTPAASSNDNAMTADPSTSEAPQPATTTPIYDGPVYWSSAHARRVSSASQASSTGAGAGIVLEDNTDAQNETNKYLWARSGSVDDYVIVSGTRMGAGSYVVWNCTLRTLDGGPMKIRKRYSEFDELRQDLVKTFHNADAILPPLPPKSVISKFRPVFLEKRKVGLNYFINCVLLNPEFAGSVIVKNFLFS